MNITENIMRNSKFILPQVIVLLFLIGCSNSETSSVTQDIEELSELNFVLSEQNFSNTHPFPRTIENEKIRMVTSSDWTSGFYPGVLWQLFELSQKEIWKERAIRFTEFLEKEQWNTTTHDVGFMMFCSYGRAYKLTKDTSYISILVQTAESLISRFNEKVGSIRSWDHLTDRYMYPVIIDNMMNLELLFWTSKITGNSKYADIALQHANTTIRDHFRKDHSSYHVVDYDPKTGEIIKKVTNQGYQDESSWARGQAWGLYGFSVCFRETNDVVYLRQAEKIADYIISRTREHTSFVPFWDHDAPSIPDEPYDASAAAITASALYLLSDYSEKKEDYINVANGILKELSSDKFLQNKNSAHGFILNHSTGNMPINSEIDVPIIYADYYFLEALLRQEKLYSKI